MKLVKTNVGKLYIGSVADAVEVNFKHDITWNLAHELSYLIPNQSKYAKLVLAAGIKDFDVPSDNNLFYYQLNKVVDCLAEGGTVFVHCLGGRGRTGMALASIKLKLKETDVDKALQFAKQNCNGPETMDQINFIKNMVD